MTDKIRRNLESNSILTSRTQWRKGEGEGYRPRCSLFCDGNRCKPVLACNDRVPGSSSLDGGHITGGIEHKAEVPSWLRVTVRGEGTGYKRLMV